MVVKAKHATDAVHIVWLSKRVHETCKRLLNVYTENGGQYDKSQIVLSDDNSIRPYSK